MRLSYHDRILKTLPEPMQTDPGVIAVQPPGPSFEYEDPCKFTQLASVALSSLVLHSESLLRRHSVSPRPPSWTFPR